MVDTRYAYGKRLERKYFRPFCRRNVLQRRSSSPHVVVSTITILSLTQHLISAVLSFPSFCGVVFLYVVLIESSTTKAIIQ